MKHRNVVITGFGFVTRFGDSPADLEAAMTASWRDGQLSNTHDARRVSDDLLAVHLQGRNLRQLDRTSRLLASAAGIALAHSGLSEVDRELQDISIVSGTMFSSAHTISEFDCRAVTEGPRYASALDFANTVLNASVGQTAICHTLRDENTTIATGLSSGLRAIASGFESIQSGRTKVVLAGGVEELSDELQCAFQESGLLCDGQPGSALPWDRRRSGMAITEAAALLVLEDEETALQREATILGRICGAGWSFDCHGRSDNNASVNSIVRTMRTAVDDAAILPKNVDCLVASANGSVREDLHESQAAVKLFGDHLPDVSVMAPKALLGESIGAGGPLQLISLLQCMSGGRTPDTSGLEHALDCNIAEVLQSRERCAAIQNALVNSICFDGNSCSLVVSRYQPFSPINN